MMTLVFNPFKYIAKNLEFESVINSKRWELLLWENYILKEYSVRHLDGRFLILWTSSCWAKRDMSTGFPKYLLSIVKWPSRLQEAMTTAAARSTCHISIDSFSKGTTSQMYLDNLLVCLSLMLTSVSVAPKSHGWCRYQPRWKQCTQGYGYSWGTLSLGNAKLIRGCGQTCPIFAPKEDVIFITLEFKQISGESRETLLS